MKIKSLIAASVLVAAVVGIPSIAKTAKTDAASKCSKAECALVCDIAQDGMAEVKMGELAEKKGSEQTVKDFAKHMVTDHSKANDQLKEAATKDGITLPTEVNAKQKATYSMFEKLSGKEFDTKYVAEMVAGHKKAVTAITKESETGTADTKKWAEKTLPTIKEHLKDIEGIQAKMK